jgi:ribonuclease P protein component
MHYSDFETLKSNMDFKKVYETGKSYANRILVMYVIENGLGTNRLGVSVSKKVGNSIVRHRLARLIRESFRLHSGDVANGHDLVVVARAGMKGKNFFETESAMLHLLKLHRLIPYNG